VWTMLGPAALTMAARSSTGAIGFRQAPEHRNVGQTPDLIE
jgi:hypothetical protein